MAGASRVPGPLARLGKMRRAQSQINSRRATKRLHRCARLLQDAMVFSRAARLEVFAIDDCALLAFWDYHCWRLSCPRVPATEKFVGVDDVSIVGIVFTPESPTSVRSLLAALP